LSQLTLRRLRPAAAISVFLLLWLKAVTAAAATPSLSIETSNVRQQGTIAFSEFAAASAAPSSDADLVSMETEDHKFKVAVDLNSIRPGRFGTFTADVYVQQVDPPSAAASKFVITGSPIGSFLDVDDRITVHVQTAGQDSQGYLNIPLHSGGQVDLIATDPTTQPLEVKLGQEKYPGLTVKNKLENLKLIITHVDVDYDCTKCWKVSNETFQVLNVDENGTAIIPLKVTPNTLSALGTSAFALKSDQAHDTLVANVTYHAAYGGQERKQRFLIPVRFTPSIWALLTAVCIGASLGFLANIVLDSKSRASWQAVLGTAGKSVVLVAIVEVVALALASYGSKVVIFTFDLDPRQFLPTVVIGVLVSGGATVVTFLKQVFGKG
jgi:hypothetical protein